MIQLTGLQPEKISPAATFQKARCITSAVHYEFPDAPGCFLHIHLGNEGVTVGHGESLVAIPLEELIALAINHEPRLVPGPSAKRTPLVAPAAPAAVHDDKFLNK